MWKSRIDRCLLKTHIEPRFVECQAAPDWTKNHADPRYCPGSNFAANYCYLVGRRLGRCWCLIGRMSLGGLQQHWTDSDRAFLAVVHPRYQVVYLKSGTLGHMSIGAGFSWHRMRGDYLLEKECTWHMSLDRMAQVIWWRKWHTGFPLANFVNGKTNEWVCMLERSFVFHFLDTGDIFYETNYTYVVTLACSRHVCSVSVIYCFTAWAGQFFIAIATKPAKVEVGAISHHLGSIAIRNFGTGSACLPWVAVLKKEEKRWRTLVDHQGDWGEKSKELTELCLQFSSTA